MRGFFDKEQLQTPYRSEKGILSCVSCGLYKTAVTPKMEPYGEFKKKIMIIGDGPGESEDQKGKPWHGKLGRILQREFKQLGVDLFEDCLSLNAVNCRPIDKKWNNRLPNDHEIACCRQKVLAAIKKHNPKVIILLGNSAISSLITGYLWKGNQNSIHTWRGWAIPDRTVNAWVCPTFHPSFIERQERPNEVGVLWRKDLKQAFAKIKEPLPKYKDEKDCIIITHDIEYVLNKLLTQKPPFLAFDIETTGLKPYNKEDHKIVSVSFCGDYDLAYAIPFPTEPKHFKMLKKLLEHPGIGKMAANMKYEDNWLTFLHDINIYPWVFDTMQASHVLDNRPRISSLKFQSYIKFGTPKYDEGIAPFLKSIDANTPNRVMQLVRDQASFKELLLYNGIDSLVDYRLAMLQMKEMKWKEMA